ncbi:MAG: TlyA family RNA methyltransferase [Candidatus Dormibacteraeota bacterium]|nr:TlyA family RNA methyltransferase [Candidatus Dormibacteraeota bacterium]
MADVTASTQRLDLELVERSLASSRERAQALIAAGLVEVDGRLAVSAGRRVSSQVEVRLIGSDHPWASRGGLKLDAALDEFAISPAGRVCLDAGASTGGFTDVLLSRGAARVYAVDVGHGLLATRIAGDVRVTVIDRTNLRTLRELPGAPPDLVTLDLSFISLRLVLPAVAALTARPADIVALFKPQFELGREAVGRGGVVRDVAVGVAAAAEFLTWVGDEYQAEHPHPPMAAPIRGAKGNQEHLVHFRLPGAAP